MKIIISNYWQFSLPLLGASLTKCSARSYCVMMIITITLFLSCFCLLSMQPKTADNTRQHVIEFIPELVDLTSVWLLTIHNIIRIGELRPMMLAHTGHKTITKCVLTHQARLASHNHCCCWYCCCITQGCGQLPCFWW